jgi:hypothetical protein
MDKKSLELLYKSLDEPLTGPEKKSLDDLKERFPRLIEEEKQILSMRQKLKLSKVESFSPYFAERVMKKLDPTAGKHQQADFFDALMTAFRPVAIATSMAIVGLLIYNFSTGDLSSLETILGVPEFKIENIAYAIQ